MLDVIERVPLLVRPRRVHNPQGSMVPNPSNVNSGTWAYNSGGAVSPHMWISWNWITFTMWRSDGTTISVLGSGSIPSPAVSLSQVAGGALGARTRFVRIALVKDGLLYMGTTNTEQNLAVSANNLLQVASPAAVAGFDGWTPLVGSASDGEFTQPGLIYTPLAFGSAWTEPVGGATVAGTTPYNSAWGSHGVSGAVTAVELVQNSTYNFYPAWSLAMGLVRFCCATGAGPGGPDPASAALQNSDGVYGLTNFTAMTAVTLTAGTPGSGNGGAGGATSKYK